ncbi:MAG: hypothetical protein K1000chlam2_00032 [Chlamydiae bacterium]|nr:hypothetical protein [Chlamydiota bacterium]
MTNDELLLCAFRHCIAKRTTAADSMAKHLKTRWAKMKSPDKKKILNEVREGLKTEDNRSHINITVWTDFLDSIGEKIYE